jgi:hypothetical protein
MAANVSMLPLFRRFPPPWSVEQETTTGFFESCEKAKPPTGGLAFIPLPHMGPVGLSEQ